MTKTFMQVCWALQCGWYDLEFEGQNPQARAEELTLRNEIGVAERRFSARMTKGYATVADQMGLKGRW